MLRTGRHSSCKDPTRARHSTPEVSRGITVTTLSLPVQRLAAHRNCTVAVTRRSHKNPGVHSMANGCLETHIHCVKPHYWAAMGHHWCWDISILRNASCRPRLLDDFVDIYDILGTLSFPLLLASSALVHLSRPLPGSEHLYAKSQS